MHMLIILLSLLPLEFIEAVRLGRPALTWLRHGHDAFRTLSDVLAPAEQNGKPIQL